MFKASVTVFGSWKAYFPPFIISETYDIISGLVSLEIISNKTYCTLQGRLDPPEGARCGEHFEQIFTQNLGHVAICALSLPLSCWMWWKLTSKSGKGWGTFWINIYLKIVHWGNILSLCCFDALIVCPNLCTLGNIIDLHFWFGECPCTFFSSVQSIMFSILLIENKLGRVVEYHVGMGSYKKNGFWRLDFRISGFQDI